MTGKPLFTAGKERSWDAFVKESKSHGWPSFRDSEVNWDYVRVLPDGECVSVDGTHLGHNLPDRSGNRYCINLVSVPPHAPRTRPLAVPPLGSAPSLAVTPLGTARGSEREMLGP